MKGFGKEIILKFKNKLENKTLLKKHEKQQKRRKPKLKSPKRLKSTRLRAGRRLLTSGAIYLIINSLKRHLAAIFSSNHVSNPVNQDFKKTVDCFCSRSVLSRLSARLDIQGDLQDPKLTRHLQLVNYKICKSVLKSASKWLPRIIFSLLKFSL